MGAELVATTTERSDTSMMLPAGRIEAGKPEASAVLTAMTRPACFNRGVTSGFQYDP